MSVSVVVVPAVVRVLPLALPLVMVLLLGVAVTCCGLMWPPLLLALLALVRSPR